jgi:hypothetical protein
MKKPSILVRSTLTALINSATHRDRTHAESQINSLRINADRGTSYLEALYRESRLGLLTWVDLLRSILDQPHVTDKVRNWSARHLLEGPQVHVVGRVGRVVEYEKMRENLIRYSPLGPAEVDALLRDLSDPVTFRKAKSKPVSGLVSLGGRPMWATFSEDPSKGPFDFCRLSTNRGLAVRTALGLESRRSRPARSHRLMLITYRLGNTPAHIPTCADAGMYDPWNYYFSPAAPGEAHGWTKPWDRGGPTIRGRPEVVHEPVPISAIDSAIELA